MSKLHDNNILLESLSEMLSNKYKCGSLIREIEVKISEK